MIAIAEDDGVVLHILVFAVGAEVQNVQAHRVFETVDTFVGPGFAMGLVDQVFVGKRWVAVADDSICSEGGTVI